MEKDIIYTKIHSTMHDYTGNVQLQNKMIICENVPRSMKTNLSFYHSYTRLIFMQKLVEQVE